MNRKQYFLLVTIAALVGFVAYGLLFARLGRQLPQIPQAAQLLEERPELLTFQSLLKTGLMGGFFLGALTSGGILFARFIMRRSTAVKVLCAVFFPFTIMGILLTGIFIGPLYYLYNAVRLLLGK